MTFPVNGTELRPMSWQTVRDWFLAALVAGLVVFIDSLTAQVQAHPLPSAALTAAVMTLLAIARRMVNPTIPVSEAKAAEIEIPDGKVPSALSELPPDQFLAECSAQVVAMTPGRKFAQFSPAIIGNVLLFLFQHREDIADLIGRLGNWFTALFARPKVRAAISEAFAANQCAATPNAIVGVEAFLRESDTAVLRRLRSVALAKIGEPRTLEINT